MTDEYRKKIYIMGGGTISHVRSHLALAAPAYGGTARELSTLCALEPHLHGLERRVLLTRMADPNREADYSLGETNDDVEWVVDQIVEDPATKVVFFSVAMCDWTGTVNGVPSGKYSGRLLSRVGDDPYIHLRPGPKVIEKIRKKRKDITLVGFKTTCGASEQSQYLAGLGLLKGASCNLVLANDVETRLNMVITPEEAKYHVTFDRHEALRGLVEMTGMRSHLTFTRSTVVAGDPTPWDSDLVPATLRKVVDHCIEQGAYKPFRGATVGHFACRIGPTTFLTSRRKTNFNDLKTLGLVKVETDGPDSVIAYGSKPSVGGQSQRYIFDENPNLDCIVHFHCPIRPGSKVPTVSQREYECGSHECGRNTARGLKEFWASTLDGEVHRFKAVFLDQHGPNIVFNRNTPPEVIAQFIDQNFDLSAKTGGPVEL